jgi:hypothetical protein
MTTNKTHHINTLNDLLDVADAENFERLMTDFAIWLSWYVQATATMKAAHPELADLRPTEIAEATFIWNDDGIHTVHPTEVVEKR